MWKDLCGLFTAYLGDGGLRSADTWTLYTYSVPTDICDAHFNHYCCFYWQGRQRCFVMLSTVHTWRLIVMYTTHNVVLNGVLSDRALTLLWFDLSKSFKICLLAKWLSIFLNLLKHSIIFCSCTTTPFNTLWKDLKGRKIGLWYTPMIKVCLFRELFDLSKPFIGPFCQTVF